VVPAPGSSSTVYRPNPGAIVVSIDPGHGGCLDWGVPNPYDNKPAKAEKADTLGIALALKALLEAQGVTVVLTRTDDSALAGDDYPPLNCHGPAWRDVNGDGLKGFGPGVPEGTRTRDELSARIDFANVAQADLAIAIHINSMTQNGVLYKIAATQTFYTDAFAWANASAKLAKDVQNGVVASMGSATTYARQDRGTDGTAPYLYELKPAGSDPRSPRRPLLMPAILTEVGSVSLEAESQLLATAAGYQAAARGIFDGIAAYLADRPLAGRLELVPASGSAALGAPTAVDGNGPPFWPEVVPSGTTLIRLVNTGSAPWPADMQLAAGWAATSMPYLAAAPKTLSPVASVPPLDPGASVELSVTLPQPASSGRQVCWLTLLEADGTPLTRRGSAPLQVANQAP
jgi:N-acetylmuramoyl-L-alanine amidase